MNIFLRTSAAFLLFIALGSNAFAQGFTSDRDSYLNRDSMPSVPKLASASDWKRANAWLESSGLSHDQDSLVGDLFHLQMGVGTPVDQDVNLLFSAGNGFRFGMTFR